MGSVLETNRDCFVSMWKFPSPLAPPVCVRVDGGGSFPTRHVHIPNSTNSGYFPTTTPQGGNAAQEPPDRRAVAARERLGVSWQRTNPQLDGAAMDCSMWSRSHHCPPHRQPVPKLGLEQGDRQGGDEGCSREWDAPVSGMFWAVDAPVSDFLGSGCSCQGMLWSVGCSQQQNGLGFPVQWDAGGSNIPEPSLLSASTLIRAGAVMK